MATKRKQLTLFLDESQSYPIEAIRQGYNPVQYALIKGHLTLCREDEIEDFEQVLTRLANLNWPSFSLEVGDLKRFSAGKGVLIEIHDPNGYFQGLRKEIIPEPRLHQPHLTLMHPRNSICTDEIFVTLQETTFPTTLSFSKVSLIEQVVGEQWQVVEEFALS